MANTMQNYGYDVNIPRTNDIRRLTFEGYAMKGKVDLTHIKKATGEAMWPCCALLADYLNTQSVFNDDVNCYLSESYNHDSNNVHLNDVKKQQNYQVLELGCGLGLAGTVASVRIGPGNGVAENSVLMTDGDLGVIERAKQISKTNYVKETDAKISFQILWWGDEEEMEKVKKNTNDCEGFDLIVASDVIYDGNALETAHKFAMTTNYLLKRDDEGHGDNRNRSHDNSIRRNDDSRSLETNSKSSNRGEIPTAANSYTSCSHKCLVAFQQRSVDVQVLKDAFDKFGFDCHVPPGDYYEDIFGERHDERTCFTDKMLLCFQRRHGHVIGGIHQRNTQNDITDSKTSPLVN